MMAIHVAPFYTESFRGVTQRRYGKSEVEGITSREMYSNHFHPGDVRTNLAHESCFITSPGLQCQVKEVE
jgi:hypothetical protein